MTYLLPELDECDDELLECEGLLLELEELLLYDLELLELLLDDGLEDEL